MLLSLTHLRWLAGAGCCAAAAIAAAFSASAACCMRDDFDISWLVLECLEGTNLGEMYCAQQD